MKISYANYHIIGLGFFIKLYFEFILIIFILFWVIYIQKLYLYLKSYLLGMYINYIFKAYLLY